ncbi:MAG: diacylglycerol kinase, partial [Desulfobacterales bacterium]
MGADNDGLMRHIVNALIWSMAGIKAAWKHEIAFRAQVVVIAIMLPVGYWLARTVVEGALLFGSCMLVLITELLNSALETIVDRIGPEPHELSGRAKDLGSAAAFFSMITAAIIWG